MEGNGPFPFQMSLTKVAVSTQRTKSAGERKYLSNALSVLMEAEYLWRECTTRSVRVRVWLIVR